MIPPRVPDVARPLPLDAVRLTGGPLARAQALDAAYLLRLEPDRMLAFYRVRAGLKPKAPGYTGWDGDGRNLTGHIAGHYLSGVSLMWAATGDKRFKDRARYIVGELKQVQDTHGDGYCGALEHGKERFLEVSRGDIRSGGFDLNGLWSPWYVLHKTFAGMRDAYRYTGDKRARDISVRFAGWVETIVGPLSPEQRQRMLATEFGGMNEVLVDLFVDTGDKRWLNLSYAFEHRAVLDPLKAGQDRLAGLHGNCQIPKLLGSLARYAAIGDAADGAAARFFWERVVRHHSYATGGHGKDEYFGAPDHLSDRVDGRTCETCNVYNMLKLTRKLFALQPGAAYAEFHERALFNHILASIDPEDGRTCYMVPVGRSAAQEYQRMEEDFTCCVGSGMESHALHGLGLYDESGDRLWVNLYAPSTARWRAQGLTLTMDTDFPDGERATITLNLRASREFTLALRRPSWAGDGFTVRVNGAAVGVSAPGTYVEVKRRWKTGDTVLVTLPKALRLEPTADDPSVAAALWGPLVLAGDLGPAERPAPPPVLVAPEPNAPSTWLTPIPGSPGRFRATGRRDDGGGERSVELAPFFRTHRRRYAVYWDVLTPDAWETRAARIAAEREAQRKREAATIAYVQPGEMQPERDFGFLQPSDVPPVRMDDRTGRRHTSWFSFEVPVDPAQPTTLVVTYNTQERQRRTFEILVDGQRVGTQTVEAWGGPGNPSRFFNVAYPIPAERTRGKKSVVVRFQAADRNGTATVYGLRTVRGETARP